MSQNSTKKTGNPLNKSASSPRTYKPDANGLAARAAAVSDARRSELHCEPAPPQVKRGALCGNALNLKADSQPAPYSETARKGARNKRKSRAARTDSGLQAVLDSFVFDYFQGVIPAHDGSAACDVGGPLETKAVAGATRFLERHGMRFGRPTSGGRGYANGIGFAFPGEHEAVGFIASGSTLGRMPHVTLKGGRGVCAELAPRLQREFPGIRLTRADTCLDIMCGESGWLDLLRISRKFAKSRGMNRPDMRGVETPEKGRTFYLGSREASVFVRVYEKGKAENSKSERAGKVGTADPSWVRIEFQFQKVESRKKAAKGAMTPAELICSHDWPRFWLATAAAELGLTEGIERAALHKAEYEPVVKTLDSTGDHGAKQYGPTFLKLAARDIIDEEYDGCVEDAVICSEKLEERASEIFLAKLREAQITDRYIAEARLDVSETLEERCYAMAGMLQRRRIDVMRRQADSRARLASQIKQGTFDDAGLERLRDDAAVAAALANEAFAMSEEAWV